MLIKKRSSASIFFLSISLLLLFIPHYSSLRGESKHSAWDGSRSVPAHRIPLMDEDNQQIIPSEPYPLPFSTRYTCGPCHDYETIRRGLHFNEGNPSAKAGRGGEPWFWVDEKTGTILPLSTRKRAGMWNLEQTGLTAWSYTLLFARHSPGGGLAEPLDKEITPDSRWDVSGKLEINCLGCHNASRIQDHSEWGKQVMRQNFRWAATAAAALGEVNGMASRLPPTWDKYDGPNPDDDVYAVVPTVKYDRSKFDSKHRVFFDIAGEPADERCLDCHSTAIAGKEKFEVDGDIHSVSGLKCAYCHRHDLSHEMIRGYETEPAAKKQTTGSAEDKMQRARNDFTCRGCHLGQAKGRLGAPWPKHKGLPKVHFERLSCTVCHAGPLPAKNPTRVRTSRANRMGIYGIAQWFTDTPHIIEPVYRRGDDGKIAPFRLAWPAFWAMEKAGKIIPLPPETVLAVGQDILNAEERVAKILDTLATIPDLKGEPVLMAAGKVFRPNADGLLDVSYNAAFPHGETTWALAIENKIIPMIPEFTADAEQLETEVEDTIIKTLEALAALPGIGMKPAVTYRNKLYRLIDGYLETSKLPGKAVPKPQLCRTAEGKMFPLVAAMDMRAVIATAGEEESLTEEQVTNILKELKKDYRVANGPDTRKSIGNTRGVSPAADVDFVYISGGKIFRLDKAGELQASDHQAAAPVSWSMAHDVRPARLSLGVNGCSDCHTANSAFFFAAVKAAGPLKTEHRAAAAMNRFMGKDKYYEKLFGLSFIVRPIFKIILFMSILVVVSLLLIILLAVLGRFAGIIEKEQARQERPLKK